MQVEVIKIGELVRQPSGKITLMIVEETDEFVSHYLSVLKDYCKHYAPQYMLMKTQGIIRGSGEDTYSFPNVGIKRNISGTPDGKPVIGERYLIDGHWGTSVIETLVSDNIFITKNSVYAIHNLQIFRDLKLKDLGV